MTSHKISGPTFIGIGAMRSATTWLSECLRYYPEIFMSIPKEIHFFSSESNWDKGIGWYMEHFCNSNGYKAVGEFSASYLPKPISAERIKNTLGQVKIIVSLRNPVDRFISHYKYLVRTGELSKKDHCKLDVKTFQKVTKLYPRLLTYGNYHSDLRRFIDIFGCRNVCIVIKEDIHENSTDVLRRVYDFLEVTPEYTPIILKKNVSSGIIPRFSALEGLRIRIFYFLNNAAPYLVGYIRKFRLAEIYRKLNSDKRPESFKTDQRVIEELALYYHAEIIKIEHLLNRELDAWKY